MNTGVLDIIGSAIALAHHHGGLEDAENIRAARDAIAKLIAADLEYDAAKAGLRSKSNMTLYRRLVRLDTAEKQRAAALAACDPKENER